MSVLSVICLAGLRKAEQNDQTRLDPGEDKRICTEYGSENAENEISNSCQS